VKDGWGDKTGAYGWSRGWGRGVFHGLACNCRCGEDEGGKQ
jgi:hypothetical protein